MVGHVSTFCGPWIYEVNMLKIVKFVILRIDSIEVPWLYVMLTLKLCKGHNIPLKGQIDLKLVASACIPRKDKIIIVHF